ncbi:MAG: TetR/AcrR family transcriptional regulator [bacterium]|nr:TetR/AcrR family transcriptional regulator [bacterium]
MSATTAPSISPPLQERSRKTLDALLRAAEAQLLEKSFSDVSVTSIVNEAGSSSGSFYARFPDKSALLHALHQRFVDRNVAQTEQMVSDLGDDKLSLDEFSAGLVDSLVESHLAHRGVIRAVLIESIRDATFAERASHLVTTVSKLVAPLLDIPGLTPRRISNEVGVGVLTLLAILDQDLFFGSALSTIQGQSGRPSKKELERLRRVFLASMRLD